MSVKMTPTRHLSASAHVKMYLICSVATFEVHEGSKGKNSEFKCVAIETIKHGEVYAFK